MNVQYVQAVPIVQTPTSVPPPHHGRTQGRQASSLGSPSRDRELYKNREREETSRCLARLQSRRIDVLPPGTPKERGAILQDAMRKALKDTEMQREFLKLVGEEVEPMMPEELTKMIRETPRDPEIIDLLKIFIGAGPLPVR